MAIIKKELNAAEMKELSAEELKQVDGGLIIMKNSVIFNEDGCADYGVFYKVYNDNGNILGIAESLDQAIEICKEFGCSTEIIDERKYYSD